MKITMLIAALSAGLLALGVQTSVYAGEIASDSFDSYSGSIDGGSGGSGWTSNWSAADGYTTAQSSTVLNYSSGSVNVNGGSASVLRAQENGAPAASRTFSNQTGVVYMSLLVQVPDQTREFVGFYLSDDTDLQNGFELGVYAGLSAADPGQIMDTIYPPTGKSRLTALYTPGDTLYLVARISDEGTASAVAGAYDKLELFINPTSTTQPAAASLVVDADASATSLSTFAYRAVNFNGDPAQIAYFDELRIGTDWASVNLHAGDANYDGMVNLADLQILGDNWQSTTATWAEADFTGDGTVNLADLQVLGDNWGFGVGADVSFDEALALVNVPEPSGLALLGAMGALIAGRRTKR